MKIEINKYCKLVGGEEIEISEKEFKKIAKYNKKFVRKIELREVESGELLEEYYTVDIVNNPDKMIKKYETGIVTTILPFPKSTLYWIGYKKTLYILGLKLFSWGGEKFIF